MGFVHADLVVPIKRLDRAKSRLRGAVAGAHAGLVLALLVDTVTAALEAEGVRRVLVVCEDDRVPPALRGTGAECVDERGLAGLNAALSYGADLLRERNRTSPVRWSARCRPTCPRCGRRSWPRRSRWPRAAGPTARTARAAARPCCWPPPGTRCGRRSGPAPRPRTRRAGRSRWVPDWTRCAVTSTPRRISRPPRSSVSAAKPRLLLGRHGSSPDHPGRTRPSGRNCWTIRL